LTKLAQDLEIGAQYGGKYFVHDVRVIRLPRHGASFPVGIGVSCSADRQIRVRISEEGLLWNPTLSLGFTTNLCNTGAKVVITVTEPLNSVSASSGSLRVDRLSGWVDMSGSGSVTIDAVNGTSFIANTFSSGGLIVHSAHATLIVDVTSGGSGQVILESLTTPTVVIDSSGSGQVHVGSGEATQSVDVSTSGSGQVMLGSLTTTNATISSSGSGGVSGMTSQNLRVQSSGSGGITTSATESFHGSCTGSASVSIAGGARVSGSCR